MTSTSFLGSCLRFARRSAPAVLAASLVACGSSNTPTTNGTAMTDANNYMATQHDLSIPTIPVKAATDLTLDWTGLMKDLLCHAITPASIQSVTFAEIPTNNKTQAQLENELAVGTFNPLNEVSQYYILDIASGSSAATTMTTMLSSLQDPTKKSFDPTTFTGASNTMYLLAFANTINLNRGVESMVFLMPDASSSTTTVKAPDACAGNFLKFMAQLGTPLSVPSAGPYTVDWSMLTKDAFGNPVSFPSIDKIEVGYYAPGSPDLQTHFEDVEQNATTLYEATGLGGVTSFDLTKTKTMDGSQSFSGFTPSDGTWAMALMCTSCPVPAPVAFTILQPK